MNAMGALVSGGELCGDAFVHQCDGGAEGGHRQRGVAPQRHLVGRGMQRKRTQSRSRIVLLRILGLDLIVGPVYTLSGPNNPSIPTT